jgi:hypothetical protein
MDNLAKCLRYYIADRLSNDPGWRNITVSIIAKKVIASPKNNKTDSNALVVFNLFKS